MKIRPFDAPGRHGRDGTGPAATTTARCRCGSSRRKLGVSRADLRDGVPRSSAPDAENDWKQEQQALAKFLADRFNLDVSTVQDALAARGARH